MDSLWPRMTSRFFAAVRDRFGNGRFALAGTLVLSALALLTGICLLPPDVFWITDEGTKFIQLQSLAATGGIEVVYPGAAIDPLLRLLPDCGHHLVRRDGKVYSLFLPYFAALNVLPFRLFGTHGIYLVPMMGAVLAAGLTTRLARSAGAGLALLFATPVFFYGITYWEHTAALALSTAAIVLIHRHAPAVPRLVGAGVLVAASTLLREEGYVLVAAICGALFIRERGIRAAAIVGVAFTVTMLPFWLWHLQIFGSVVGLHGSIYSEFSGGSWNPARTVFDLLIRFRSPVALSLLLAAPQLVAPFVSARWRKAVLAASCVSAMAAVILLATDGERILATGPATGLLPGLPFVTLALLTWREGERFLQVICVLYVLGSCAVLTTAGIWIIWGPRHFFPIFPLLVALSLRASEHLKSRWLPALLIACAILLQGVGIANLALKKRGTERIRDAIVADGTTVVLTDVFWLPQEMASLFYDRTFLLAYRDADALTAMRILRARGVERITFVASRDYRMLSNQSLAPIMSTALRRTRVVTPGMEFLDVMVVSCDLRRLP